MGWAADTQGSSASGVVECFAQNHEVDLLQKRVENIKHLWPSEKDNCHLRQNMQGGQ